MNQKTCSLVFVLAAMSLPAFAAAPAAPAPEAPAAPVAEPVTHLPPESAGEPELRAQLEQVRALNAQLRQEREQLQQQLATVQAAVAVEDKRLKQPAPLVAEAGANFYLLAGGGAGALGVMGLVFVLLRRGRKAAGAA